MGVSLRVATPEDLVVLKALMQGDRDRADIERVLLVHAVDVKLAQVRRLVGVFAEAVEEPERIGDFDALVRRTLRNR
ncbi:MAG: hypothetical protein JNM38_12420 [Acidobacteria bacterium]|nr:hypothetical protein [Acidobacteriota bacterium]